MQVSPNEYLETALQPVKGAGRSVEAKNAVSYLYPTADAVPEPAALSCLICPCSYKTCMPFCDPTPATPSNCCMRPVYYLSPSDNKSHHRGQEKRTLLAHLSLHTCDVRC